MRLLLVAILIFVAGLAQAEDGFVTGNKLQEVCLDAGKGNYSGGYCAGFIGGVATTIVALDEAGLIRHCMPTGDAGVTMGQLSNVWEKWASDHPEIMHHAAALLVMRAFQEAFPCPQEQQ